MPSVDPLDSAPRSIDARHARQDKAVQAWLLALLRFAVTHDPADRSEALTAARDLDRIGKTPAMASSFRFFQGATGELCQAIASPMHPGRAEILRRHLARMDDARLRRTFAAAVEVDLAGSGRTAAVAAAPPARLSLWRGLRS